MSDVGDIYSGYSAWNAWLSKQNKEGSLIESIRKPVKQIYAEMF